MQQLTRNRSSKFFIAISSYSGQREQSKYKRNHRQGFSRPLDYRYAFRPTTEVFNTYQYLRISRIKGPRLKDINVDVSETCLCWREKYEWSSNMALDFITLTTKARARQVSNYAYYVRPGNSHTITRFTEAAMRMG